MAAQNKTNMGQLVAVMGTAVMLARASRLHATYRLAEFVDRVWPSLLRGQYALYTDKDSGKPVGFCSWAWISEQVLEDYKNRRHVKPNDWDSGKILFYQEMIATQGHLRRIIRDLKHNIMPQAEGAYALRGVILKKGEEDKKQRVMRFTGLGKADAKPDRVDTIRRI